MAAGFPLTLGFTPDDALIDYLVEVVTRGGFDHAIARSVVKQLIDTITVDFVDGVLYDYLAETDEYGLFNACYASYRPKECRCFGTTYIYFQVTFYSLDLTDFDVVDIEMSDESVLSFMPQRDFVPAPEERHQQY